MYLAVAYVNQRLYVVTLTIFWHWAQSEPNIMNGELGTDVVVIRPDGIRMIISGIFVRNNRG